MARRQEACDATGATPGERGAVTVMGRPRKGGELSDAEKRRMLTLYTGYGLTAGQLAVRFGCSKDAVRQVLRTFGIKPANRAEAET